MLSVLGGTLPGPRDVRISDGRVCRTIRAGVRHQGADSQPESGGRLRQAPVSLGLGGGGQRRRRRVRARSAKVEVGSGCSITTTTTADAARLRHVVGGFHGASISPIWLERLRGRVVINVLTGSRLRGGGVRLGQEDWRRGSAGRARLFCLIGVLIGCWSLTALCAFRPGRTGLGWRTSGGSTGLLPPPSVLQTHPGAGGTGLWALCAAAEPNPMDLLSRWPS